MITSPVASENRHKVLLVDDDAVSLELMAILLTHDGHQVLRANDAGAAKELLSAEQAIRPDVMLVDLQMPGVSGGQLAERVRALGSPEPLLLAMSATEAQRQQLLAFDGYLLKPLALEDLRQALKPRKKTRTSVPAKARPRPMTLAPKQQKMIAAPDAVLDNTVVNKLLTMMPMASLLDIFAACIADTRTCVNALKKQLQAGDSSGVRESAHRIKGAASMIGATHLSRLAANLEMGGSKEAATPSLLDDLLNACSALESMLLAGKFKIT